jgi:CheY-like chemotaxis protein
MRDWRARRPARDVPILVVDDDAVVRRLARAMLEGTGYRAQLALQVATALDGAVERRYWT